LSGSSYLGAVAALGAVLLVIVGLGRVAGRLRLPLLMRGAVPAETAVSVRSSVALDAKRRLVIVTWEGRDGLILLGPEGDLLLGWNDGPGMAT
jgi:hypothetical protein